MRCGLLGRKLGHSYSPQIHSYLGDYSYKLYEVEPEDLGNFLQDTDFSGLNVTMPYKKDVIPYCSKLSQQAQKLGAVNTLIKQEDGTIIGHNTDYFGFSYMLDETGLQVSSKKVLVLGSGGASATVAAVLAERGAQVIIVSRNGNDNYGNLYRHSDASVVVNATPVGMFPDTNIAPIDIDQFPRLEGVLDLVYNPARTALLQQAEQRGLVAKNGLSMLIAQAKESAEWFTNSKIDDQVIHTIYQKLQLHTENIILIGMPGCGKTTIGQLLANKLGRKFVDTDLYIQSTAGKHPAEIITQCGEENFRKLETEAIAALCKQSNLVIATGGGCVTRDENYPLMHQNGRLIWIQRDIAELPTSGRPLSQQGSLAEMLKIRTPMYQRFSDYSVVNQSTQEDAVATILQLLNKEV